MNDTPEITARNNDARLESIWDRRRQELKYWIDEWLNGCGCKNVSIHTFDQWELQSVLIFDMDGKDAILLETDTTAENADTSHKCMILDAVIVAKLASLHALPLTDQDE